MSPEKKSGLTLLEKSQASGRGVLYLGGGVVEHTRIHLGKKS